MERTDLPAIARALGDPTRQRLFELLAVSADPLEVSALAAALGVHHSVVRDHLRRLVEVGAVVERPSEPQGRGRPPRRYAAQPDVVDRWRGEDRYADLAAVLAAAVRKGLPAREAGRQAAAGERVPGAAATGDPVDVLEAEARRLGFRPTRHEHDGQVELVLHACPYAALARHDPDTVCDVHLGLAEGIVHAVGGLTVEGLARRPPEQAGCRLRVRRA